MKRFIFLFFFILTYFGTFGQSVNQNYIFTNEPQIPVTDPSTLGSLSDSENFQTIQYFDGLGRIIQTVKKQFSPLHKDFVQPVEYDAFGREPIEFLPYISSNTDGSYNGNYQSVQLSFYSNPPTGVASTGTPIAENVYDNSPLNQIVEKGFAGEDWQVVGHHTIRTSNTCNQTQDSVRMWITSNSVLGGFSGYYPAGSLYKVYQLDENSDTSVEYSDKIGHKILVEHIVAGKELRTYYLYDDFDRLQTVLTPLGESKVRSTEPFSFSALFDLAYCYNYNYDERGRMVSKHIPDQDTIIMEYDVYDRLIKSSDGNLRDKNEKIYYDYDQLNRFIVKGLLIGGIKTPQEYTYYDNYDFNNDGSPDYYYHSDSDFPNNSPDNTNIGRVTGTSTLVLDGSNTWLTTPIFYDKYDRVLQQQKLSFCRALDTYTYGYDFRGRVLKAKQIHQCTEFTPITTQTISKEYQYDNAGRLRTTSQKLNLQNLTVISQLTYNELGQSIQKDLGGLSNNTFLQSLHYGYNIRGWLQNINYLQDLGNTNELFAEEIGYQQNTWNGLPNIPNSPSGSLFTTTNGLMAKSQYNGNISYALWGTRHGGYKYSYTYYYDNINRLTGARFAELPNGSQWKYSDKYTELGDTYDENGNFITANRHGYSPSTQQFGVIDSLTYYYYPTGGNLLQGVHDLQSLSSGYDFWNPEGFSQRVYYYGYDKNGNLKYDVNSGIVNITYNYLNLPDTIDLGNNVLVAYLYDSQGKKLSATLFYDGKLKTTVYYVNEFVYEDKTLDFIIADEGRIVYDTGEVFYEYYIKDHLGDVRVCFEDRGNGVPVVTQERDYYPFGLTMKGLEFDSLPLALAPKYIFNENKYNGKEFQEFLDLQLYDYGARFYNQQIGRWLSIDPLAEKYYPLSPYVYCADIPTFLTDFNGKDWTISSNTDKKGNITFKVSFTAAVLNSSSNKFLNTSAFAKAVKSQTENLFNVTGKGFSVSCDVQIRNIDDKNSLKNDETLIEVKNYNDPDLNVYDDPDVKTVAKANNGKEISVSSLFVDDIITGKNTKTMPHEIGHTGGLKHPDDDKTEYLWGLITTYGPTYNSPASNFMRQGTIKNPTGPTFNQINRIYNLYKAGGLNKSTGISPIDQ